MDCGEGKLRRIGRDEWRECKRGRDPSLVAEKRDDDDGAGDAMRVRGRL